MEIDNSIEMVKPKTDVVFKKMFADENNKGLLIDLLASLLDMDKSSIRGIQVTNPEIVLGSEDEKLSRLDIVMETNDKLIDLEMQTYAQKDFINREIVYLAKMIAGDVKKGEPYSKLRQTISISILDYDYNIFKHSNYASMFTLYDQQNKVQLSDKCVLYFFELHKMNKLEKKLSEFNPKELWLRLINSESWEELNMIKELNNPVLNEAIDVVNSMSRDPKIREMIRQREFAEHERASIWADGNEAGIDGLAKRLIAMGLDETVVQKAVSEMKSNNQ